MERLTQLHGIIQRLELAGAWYTASLVREELERLIKEMLCEQNE
jgi:hypothetical protein